MNDKQRKAMFAKKGKKTTAVRNAPVNRALAETRAFWQGRVNEADERLTKLRQQEERHERELDALDVARKDVARKGDVKRGEDLLHQRNLAVELLAVVRANRQRAEDFLSQQKKRQRKAVQDKATEGHTTVADVKGKPGVFDTDWADRRGLKPSGYGGARSLEAAREIADELAASGHETSIVVTPERLAMDGQRRFYVYVRPEVRA